MAEESFLYCSDSDEEVFIGKITDVEIKKMQSLGIETGDIPEHRLAKNTRQKTAGEKSDQNQSDNIEEGSDIEVIELVAKNDSVLVISSDSDDSFLDTVSRPSTACVFDEKRYAEAVGGLDDDNRSNVVTDFGNQTPKTVEAFNENRAFPLSPYGLNDLTQGTSTTSPPTLDGSNAVTDFENQPPNTIEIEDLNENTSFHFSPYRLNDLTQGTSTTSPPTPDRSNAITDFENQPPKTIEIEALNENKIFNVQYQSPSDNWKRSIAQSRPTEASFTSINAISDSVLNISHGSTISSPIYEDVTETDLHMSVDDTDYQSALGSDRIPSASSYYTTASAPQQASFEQYRTSENQIDLDDFYDIKNSVIEKSFETSTSTSTSSCDKPQTHTFTSKLPVWNSSGLIKPPKLVLPKTVARETPRPLKNTKSIPSMLPKPKSTPVSKTPSTISSETKLVPSKLQQKTLSSSKKNLRYGNIISPIRAYIQGTPVAMMQNGDGPATATLTRQPGMLPKSAAKEVKPSLISKRLHFNKSSKEGQENVDPSRDTLPPRAFEHAARVVMEEPEHPARRLPKVGADLKHMISPSLKITTHKGRLGPSSIPRITVQSPSPLKPANTRSRHQISIRIEESVDL